MTRSESLTRVRAARKMCHEIGAMVRLESSVMGEEEEGKNVDMSGIACHDYEELVMKRKRAIRACVKIGWTGKKKECPNFEMMKRKMEYIVEKRCGAGGVQKWRRVVSIKERRVVVAPEGL